MMKFYNNQQIYADSDFLYEDLTTELPTILGLDVEIYHVQGQEMVNLSDIKKIFEKLGLAIK